MREPMLQRLEADLFRNLNQIVEPLVRAGFGSPVFWPTAAIVLETTGRKSGQPVRVPLLAMRWGEFLIVSTVRRRSQWLRNLAANGDAHYWLGGKRHDARAWVIATGLAAAKDSEATGEIQPSRLACLVRLLQQQSRLLGVSFAILSPRS